MTNNLHTGRYKIEPGRKVDLDKFDPRDTSGFEGNDAEEKKESEKLRQDLRSL